MKMNRKILMNLLIISLVAIFLGIFTNEVRAEENEFIYVSDIEYVKNLSSVGWKEITLDKTPDNTALSVKVEGAAYTFNKGIFAHANSTVVYDLTNYSQYRYFTAYVGLNTTSTRGDGVKFDILTSADGSTWESKMENGPLDKLPGQNASFVKIDIRGAKYLKLVANQKTGNASDHSVYADAKLIIDGYDESNGLKSIDEYDEMLKKFDGQDIKENEEYELILLQREFVSRAGEYAIKRFMNEDEANKETIEWLFSDVENIRYYILGGTPSGSYYNSLKQLSRLVKAYRSDFDIDVPLKSGGTRGQLYKRMAVAISLTHSVRVGLWMQTNEYNNSDALVRYDLYKYLYENGKFKKTNSVDITPWFESYSIEELRWVVGTLIDDEEVIWLNEYVQSKIDAAPNNAWGLLTPHSYMAYVWPSYGNPVYYAEENKEYFNQLFSVPDEEHEGQRIGLWDVVYKIPGGVDEKEYILQIPRGTSNNKIYKVWMNMRNKFGTGAVCGGISKTGSNIRGVLGLPDAVVGQPGHAAHINYFQNSNGEGFWGIDNDVSGWAYTGSSGLLGWANGPYASGYTGTYIHLAQEVINHEDTYEQSQKFVYLADSYQDLAKKEEMYRKALEVQPLNLNAWYGLILTYNASENKTEEQYFELAKEIAENLKYYPLPMYQMTNQIKPKLTSQQESYKFTLLQTRILKEGSVLPNSSTAVLQPNITRLMANYILGQMDTTIATFSFDGEDAGKIVLSSRFDGNGVRWDYSLDGKNTWKEVSFSAEEEHKLQLTADEIASITSENDLYVHIVGVNYSEENLYKIDIQESVGLPSTLFASDLENKILGAVDSVQWKYKESDEWKFYGESQPDLTGDKTVILKMGATGTYLASNTSTTYTFTEDVIDKKRKYISVDHLSIHAVSSEATGSGQNGNAIYALDGNYNTRWHSDWIGGDTKRFITVKLDHPYNISAVEFVPAGGGNGKIYDGTVWGSMDGENWFVLSQQKGLTYTNQADTLQQLTNNIKSFEVDIPQRVQYVKIVADRTNGNWFAARAFNFYEDTTIKNVATFSFDGANAGVISLYDEYKGTKWKYSLDSGKTWHSTEGDSHQLTQSEIEQIDINSMIKVKFDNDNEIYTITIKQFDIPEAGFLNDFENIIIDQPNKSVLEWKFADENEWSPYQEEGPGIVDGNKTVLVRRKASGISMASKPLEYKFTDNNTKEETYIPIKHLSIHGFSSQSQDSKRPYYAVNAIDGNINTQWHTNFKVAEKTSYISIKLDKPRYISAVDYFHIAAEKESFGYMKNAIVSVSEDGESWIEVASVQNHPQEDFSRHISFDESVYGQYVKITMQSYDNIFATAAMINIYEDLTKAPIVEPEVEIKYSTTKWTNKNVVATLITEDDIEITNNNGSKTHTFTKNGEFTFEYKDKVTNRNYSIKATVKNTDKEAPTSTLNEMELVTEIPAERVTDKTVKPATSFANGEGTKESPFEISNAAELQYFANLFYDIQLADNESIFDYQNKYQSAYYILTNDIVINSDDEMKTADTKAPTYKWDAIGRNSGDYDNITYLDFEGNFDGRNHYISGLYNCVLGEGTNSPDATIGLFANLKGATVSNLTIKNSYFYVYNTVGGIGALASSAYNSFIDNCHCENVNIYAHSSIGGTAGFIGSVISTANITNCSVSGNIYGGYSSDVAGITAFAADGII